MRFFVPGRIEVLGKHTDYAGGRSLLCAMERGIVASVTPRRDALIRVTDTARGETRQVALSAGVTVEPGDWSAYVATVGRRVAANFPDARRGADISFESNLPIASGMSSSTALTVAVFLAIAEVNELPNDARYKSAIRSNEELAAYLASVEMGGDFGPLSGGDGVGMLGGSEDHAAILCCKADTLSRYSFIPTRHEGDIPFPADRSFVLAFSGIAAEKTGAAMAPYNELSLSARKILALWNEATGRDDRSLGGVLAERAGAEAHIRRLVADAPRLRDRFDQFVLESTQIIPRACDALARGDVATFGDLVAASQLGAEFLLGNQIPATLALVRMARELGAGAASAFGGGFGGSVWALVRAGDAESFMTDWKSAYARAFPEAAGRAVFFVTRPGRGAGLR